MNQRSTHHAGLHSRGYLPHLKAIGRPYFVTFRLAGTLPKERLVELKQEREIIMRQAEANKRPLTRAEQEALFIWYSTKVDKLLDAAEGDCFLRQPEIANLVAHALRFFEGQRYHLHAWVVMPNHVHAVVRPEPPFNLSQILHSWKSYTANEANKRLRRIGQRFWQPESFDHVTRDDDDLARCVHYTLDNPVMACLCARREDWRWSSAFRASV